MLPIASLVEGSVADAVAWLSERAATARTGGLSWAEKRAAESSGVLSSLGDAVSGNPVLGKALLGGGIGALAGAGQHLFADEEDRKGRSLLSRAATGGLAGAAIGGGVGAVQHSGLGSEIGKAVMGGGKGGGAGKADGVFQAGGKTYRVDPSILDGDPALLGKVQGLTSKPWYETVPNQAMNFLFKNPIAPTMTPIMAGIGVGDAIAHNAQIGDKNWFKPFGKNLFGKTVAGWGEKMRDAGIFPGMIDPKNSRNPDHMRRGIADAVKEDHNFARPAKDVLKAIDANEPIAEVPGPVRVPARGGHAIRDQLAKNPGKGHDHLYPEIEREQYVPVTKTVTTNSNGGVPGGPPAGRQTVATTEDALRKVKNFEHQPVTPELRGQLAEHGAKLEAAEMAKNPMYKDMKPTDQPRIYRPGLGMKDRHLPIGALQGGRGLGRLAFYGLPLAGEWAWRNYRQDVNQSQSLRQILEEARRKGHIREEGGD